MSIFKYTYLVNSIAHWLPKLQHNFCLQKDTAPETCWKGEGENKATGKASWWSSKCVPCRKDFSYDWIWKCIRQAIWIFEKPADSPFTGRVRRAEVKAWEWMWWGIKSFIWIANHASCSLSILLHTDCPSCSTAFACKRILLRKLVEKAKVKTKPPEKPADDHRSVCPAEKISVTIGSENVFGKPSESLKNQQIHPLPQPKANCTGASPHRTSGVYASPPEVRQLLAPRLLQALSSCVQAFVQVSCIFESTLNFSNILLTWWRLPTETYAKNPLTDQYAA